MLVENNPNSRMVLARNPNFRGGPIPARAKPPIRRGRPAGGLRQSSCPSSSGPSSRARREAIPYWNKFLQGWYDASGISSDSFDQAVKINVGGDVALTDEMQQKGIRLVTSVRSSTFYMGFNMLDAVVGGDAKKLWAGRLDRARSGGVHFHFHERPRHPGRGRCRPASSAMSKARRGSTGSSRMA